MSPYQPTVVNSGETALAVHVRDSQSLTYCGVLDDTSTSTTNHTKNATNRKVDACLLSVPLSFSNKPRFTVTKDPCILRNWFCFEYENLVVPFHQSCVEVESFILIIMKIAVVVLSVVSPALAFSTWSVTQRPYSLSTPMGPMRRFAQTEEKPGLFSEDVQQEAREVLERVGWARPMEGEGEMTSDDPFVKQINEGIRRDFGVDLDDLLNPAKVR